MRTHWETITNFMGLPPIPRFRAYLGAISDGFSCYLSALIEVYHTLKTFPRTGKPGRPKHPVKEPHSDLVYGQVVKKKHQGRLQELVYRVRCGSKRLEALGLSISTSAG